MNSTPQQFASRNGLPELLAEAENCLARYDFPAAIEIFQRVHKLRSTDTTAIKLGAAHANAYDFSAAERCFEEGIRLSATKAGALHAVGSCWIEVRNYEAAKKCFERVLQLNEVPIATFIKLGEIYIRQRRLDDALEIAERAQRKFPEHPGASILRAKVHRQQKQWEEAEKALRSVMAKSDSDTQALAAAAYELAAVLDQQGRYDEAMAAFVEAKSLMNLTAARALKIWRGKQAWVKTAQATITEDVIQRWRKFGRTELQPARKLALLCGEARSGTTLLEYVLDSHPGIISAEETSVFHHTANFPLSRAMSSSHSFVSSLDWMSARNIRQIRTDYFRGIESFLGEAVGDRLLLDKNPTMTFDVPAIARILPEIKFLVAVRDPRDVCLSCFMQAAPLLPDTVSWLSLEGTIEHYALIMGSLLAWKPALGEAAIEVRYEDMVEGLESTARRVLGFLGLDWDERVLRFNEHAAKKTVLSPTFADVTKPIYKSSVGRWRNYQKHFEPHWEKLAPFLRSFGYE